MTCGRGTSHILESGKLKYVHVAVDTFSKHVCASALPGEKATRVCRHWSHCFATVGLPRSIKTDQGPGYKSEWVKLFLQQWSVSHAFGSPYYPQGESIMEGMHASLKTTLLKQKRENMIFLQEKLDNTVYLL